MTNGLRPLRKALTELLADAKSAMRHVPAGEEAQLDTSILAAELALKEAEPAVHTTCTADQLLWQTQNGWQLVERFDETQVFTADDVVPPPPAHVNMGGYYNHNERYKRPIGVGPVARFLLMQDAGNAIEEARREVSVANGEVLKARDAQRLAEEKAAKLVDEVAAALKLQHVAELDRATWRKKAEEAAEAAAGKRDLEMEAGFVRLAIGSEKYDSIVSLGKEAKK